MRKYGSYGAWLSMLVFVIVLGCSQSDPVDPISSQEAALEEPMALPFGPPHIHDIRNWASRRAFDAAEWVKGEPFLAPPGDSDPVPIPGGLAPGLHLWLPGPVPFGFQGENVEPNTITNFQGFAAIAYLTGVATGSDGNTYEQFHDMRVYSGNYLTADGTHHSGTFAFI